MNENETHAPCEVYATEVATEVTSMEQASYMINSLLQQLEKQQLIISDLAERIAKLEQQTAFIADFALWTLEARVEAVEQRLAASN